MNVLILDYLLNGCKMNENSSDIYIICLRYACNVQFTYPFCSP